MGKKESGGKKMRLFVAVIWLQREAQYNEPIIIYRTITIAHLLLELEVLTEAVTVHLRLAHDAADLQRFLRLLPLV